MKNQKKKALLAISVIAIISMIFVPNMSKAALQANPTTHKSPVTKYGATWIKQIRQMETTGQTMGLDETLNGLEATSEENGIDVHMMLPTEYGAVAILSASGYGNPGKLKDEADLQKRTTTGNATGVYFTGNRWEISASVDSGKYVNNDITSSGSIMLFTGNGKWHSGSSASRWTIYDNGYGSVQIYPGSSQGKLDPIVLGR